MLNKHEN